jgi:tRNA A-37 threonylcarbamoyl transferase component Bud32
MTSRDVFISHSSDDAEVARALRTVLEGAGYSCWMAPDDIVGTETWTEQILGAIEDSKAMLVLISSASNQSPHVSREVNLALGKKRAVLPIRIENVAPQGSLEYLLSLVQRVDAFPPPVEGHGDRILRRLQTIIQRPPSDPATPRDRTTEHTPTTTGSGSGSASAPTPAPAPEAPPTPAPESPAPPAPRQPADIGPGSVVGAFTVESVLGQGGMATIYRARQAEPNRPVALKVIRADHAADQAYRRRFLAEKETLAALEHPSIVPIYAAGEADGVLYIAMRLVDGPDLQARIASQGRLSLRETIQTLTPIADAVDYAHAAGVVHRDLKPSNIILDRAGRPYLTDFGLGKHVEVDSNLSAPGVAIGTLDYMAPEQFTAAGEGKAMPSIDVYALGCVAFQCLTGQAPFVRSTPQALMYAHTHEQPPSLRSLRPEYPPELDAVFTRVLAKDPAARYESARAFVGALSAVADAAAGGQTREIPIPGGSTPAAGIRRWIGANTGLAVGGAAIALALAVVLGAGLVFKPGGSPEPTRGAVSSTVPATAGATVAPTGVPVTTAGPGGPLSTDEQLLQATLPAVAGIDQCVSWATPPGGTDVLSPSGYGASMARLTCPGPSGDASVEYALYSTKEALKAEFDGIMASAGVAAGGACVTAIPANAAWSFPNSLPSGDLGCYERGGHVQWVWTQNALRVLGQWLAPDNPTGRSFWQTWTTTRNAAELTLLANLPASVDDNGACVRAEDLYWAGAIATLACPMPAPQYPVYYAQFESADAFPDDPMTADFYAVMERGGWTTDTDEGPYSSPPTFGRYQWHYLTNGVAGPTEGYIGAYSRTDGANAVAQYIWTFNRSAIMGVWYAPDLQTGIDFFDDWIAELD